jgi:hypothetical protein
MDVLKSPDNDPALIDSPIITKKQVLLSMEDFE